MKGILIVTGVIFLFFSYASAQDKVVVIRLFEAESTSSAPSAPVEKTGQTICYDQYGMVVDCPGNSGQDGDLQKGVAWPNPRFTDNLNGTVTDNLTGLIWLKNANCPGPRTWADAMADVTQLSTQGTMNNNDCGDTSNGGSHQTDWRLPNLRELQSLVHYGMHNPTVPNTAGTGQWSEGYPFTGVQSANYWTSTTVTGDASYAWAVSMFWGNPYYREKTSLPYVWPVRAGN